MDSNNSNEISDTESSTNTSTNTSDDNSRSELAKIRFNIIQKQVYTQMLLYAGNAQWYRKISMITFLSTLILAGISGIINIINGNNTTQAEEQRISTPILMGIIAGITSTSRYFDIDGCKVSYEYFAIRLHSIYENMRINSEVGGISVQDIENLSTAGLNILAEVRARITYVPWNSIISND